MFILYAIVLGLLIGWLRGGRLAHLLQHPLGYKGLTICSMLIQLIIFREGTTIDAHWIVLLHFISYAALLVFILKNREVGGMPIIGMGLFLNTLVIFLNGGYMPARVENVDGTSMSQFAASLNQGSPIHNSTALSEYTRLPWLADIFVLPGWLPLSNVFSIGDVLIALGICLYLVINMNQMDNTVNSKEGPFTHQ